MADTLRLDVIARAGFTADLLALGRTIDGWSTAVALVAIAGMPFLPDMAAGLLASLAAGAAAKFHALRVRLDEAVFRRWARQLADPRAAEADACMAAFDRALGRQPSGRTLADRCRGARRLLGWQAAYAVLQTACVAGAAIHRYLR